MGYYVHNFLRLNGKQESKYERTKSYRWANKKGEKTKKYLLELLHSLFQWIHSLIYSCGMDTKD